MKPSVSLLLVATTLTSSAAFAAKQGQWSGAQSPHVTSFATVMTWDICHALLIGSQRLASLTQV